MAGIYHNATLGVISLSSDGESWITIADKNLGATQVRNNGDTLSEANCGKYYQRGNNYGFPFSGNVTSSSTKPNANNYGPGNYYNSYIFITNGGGGYWDTGNNCNLWGDITDTLAARQGPCDNGFHIPTNTEWQSLKDIWTSLGGGSSDGNNFGITFKMPYNGYLSTTPAVDGRGNLCLYWSSSTTSSFTYNFYFKSNTISSYAENRATGLSVRPFKNEAEIPYADEGWTKLYGDDLPPRPTPIPKLKWLVKGSTYYYFGEAPVHASGITLDKSSITLTTAGQTEQLTATVIPDDAVDKKVIWTSSDTTIATVSSTGLVTCVTPGECTITATCDGVSASCSIMSIKYVDFLLIAGGGGGGGWQGGGGGAGGMVYCSSAELSCSMYNVVIGTGGNGGNSNCQKGCNGGNSIFGETVAYGGGGGGSANNANCLPASSGGSGGGAGWGYYQYGCSGTPGQGNSGGGAHQNCGAGGGGGAGGQGCSGGSGACGGIGLANNISGTSVYYSGGGAGYRPTANSTGGCGGGGNSCTEGNGGNATYYGGGGGGGGYYNGGSNGGNGCQGIFILRYLTACGYNITGGTCYTCGDYTIHCFTSNGTLTVS